MKRILVVGKSSYRLEEPYKNISCEGVEFIFATGEVKLYDSFEYDGLLIHQPTIDIHENFVKEYRKQGKLFVVDVDDDLTILPFSNPVFQNMREEDRAKFYKNALQLCDYIHVSTPELKESLCQVKKTEVFSNAIDLKKYDTDIQDVRNVFRNTYKIPAEDKIVAWFGSHTHHADLELIFPVINELFRRKNITVVLCSSIKWLRQIGFRSEHFPKLVALDYLPFDMYCNTIGIADVSLAPLVKNKFNACKSEIKVMEAAVHGVPSVVSAVAPYQRFAGASNRERVFLVQKGRIALWMNAIDSALGYLGGAAGENARQAVESNYNLEMINKERALWWKAKMK